MLELTFGSSCSTGLNFCDAVAETRKNQMLHDQFGKLALIEMLISAIY